MMYAKFTRVTRLEPTYSERSFLHIINSGSYKKKINEMGEISVTINYPVDSDDLPELNDKITIINGTRSGTDIIAIGYVVDLKPKGNTVTIKAFTQEYLLKNAITPTDYTANLTGLSLSTLCRNYLTKKFTQVRYSDRENWGDIVTDLTPGDEPVYQTDNLGVPCLHSGTQVRDFYLRVLDIKNESGVFKDFNGYSANYDVVITLDMHPNYYPDTGYSKNAFDLEKTDSYEKMWYSDYKYNDIYIHSATGVVSTGSGAGLDTSWGIIRIDNFNLDSNNMPAVAGYKIKNGRGRILEIYLDSSSTYFGDTYEAITQGEFVDGTGASAYIPSVNFIKILTRGIAKYSFGTDFDVHLKFNSGILFDNQFIDRFRWSMPYYEDLRFNALSFSYNTTAYPTFGGAPKGYPSYNEFLEATGRFLYTNASSLYFTLRLGDYTPISDDNRYSISNDLLGTDIIKAVEFDVLTPSFSEVGYIDPAISDISVFVENADNTSHYDILKKAAEDLEAVFYFGTDLDKPAELEKLNIYKKTNISGTSHRLIDGLNCEITNTQINDEDSYADVKLIGEGDSLINRPLVNYAEPYIQRPTKQKSLNVNYATRQDVLDNETDIISGINVNDSVNISVNTANRKIAEGDTITVVDPAKDIIYEDLIVVEVSYSFNSSQFTSNINTRSVNRLT